MKKYMYILFFLLGIGIVKYESKNYTINITRSLPLGIYRLEEAQNIKIGDIVQFQLEEKEMKFLKERGYLPEIADTLLKIVAANKETAKKIHIEENGLFPILYIENKNWGPIFKKDSKGRNIPSLSLEEIRPEEGEYLLLSPIFKSYDGRYWGSISEDRILHKAVPIFTLQN